MSLIENSHTKLLARAMDVYAMRQKITSANIANIDTPGYNKLSVKFEEFLRRLEDGEDLSNVAPEVVQTDQAPILEDEMLEMADTQIRVQMTVRALRTEYEILRSSITENSV